MQCPKCKANDQSASHDPWSGRPVIACNACGDYVEDDFTHRQRAYAIIADIVASSLIGEHQGGPQGVAGEILAGLENAGLRIARA
ncbi:hypothetical protein Q2941_30640 [Bradyrhizobium sp. UFLA05-153]